MILCGCIWQCLDAQPTNWHQFFTAVRIDSRKNGTTSAENNTAARKVTVEKVLNRRLQVIFPGRWKGSISRFFATGFAHIKYSLGILFYLPPKIGPRLLVSVFLSGNPQCPSRLPRELVLIKSHRKECELNANSLLKPQRTQSTGFTRYFPQILFRERWLYFPNCLI